MLHCVQEHHSLLVCHAVQHHSLGGHKQVPHDMYGTSAIFIIYYIIDAHRTALILRWRHTARGHMSLCKIETKRYHQYVEYSETAQQREERHASEE